MLPAVGLLLFLIAVVAVARWLRTSTWVVSEDQRLVVYRLGRFDRVAGPGPVLVLPRLDRVARSYLVRNEPLECVVDDIFVYGVPIGVTVSLWGCFDLERAAGGNRDMLANFAKFGYPERHRQVCAKVREALIHQLQQMEERQPLPVGAGIAERLLPVIPGAPQCDELLGLVRQEIGETLLSVGCVLNTAQPVTIIGLKASDHLVQAFERDRVASIDRKRLADFIDALRERLPNMQDEVLAQLAAALYGLDSVTLKTLLLPEGAGIRYEIEEEGEEARLAWSGHGRRREAAPHDAGQERSGDITPQPTERLTKSDLLVLKRVPRAVQDQHSET